MKLTKELKKDITMFFGNDASFIFKTIDYVSKKHRGQKRDGGSPYVWHPVRVAEYVRGFKSSKNIKELYVSALLHDILEDTYTSYRELCDKFGEMVASIVMEVSSASYAKNVLEGGKAEYLCKTMENMTNYALVVKLCDRLDNLTCSMECTLEKRQKMINDTKIILSHLKTKRFGTMFYLLYTHHYLHHI